MVARGDEVLEWEMYYAARLINGFVMELNHESEKVIWLPIGKGLENLEAKESEAMLRGLVRILA